MAQSQTQLVVMADQIMVPLRQMSLSLLSLFLMTLLKLVNQKLVLKMLWSMGVTLPCCPMT